MCCSYGYETGSAVDVSRIADRISPGVQSFRYGDIRPSDPAVILKAGKERSEVYADTMAWGFFSFDNKLLINARAESATQKRSFAESVLRRRCIIPAGCFYEWDQKKIRNTFTDPDGSSLFMAGFYNLFENNNRFIILTTGANESMAPVHDRMPLILPEDQIREWIWRDDLVLDFLAAQPPELSRKPEYEQLSFFDYMQQE